MTRDQVNRLATLAYDAAQLIVELRGERQAAESGGVKGQIRATLNNLERAHHYLDSSLRIASKPPRGLPR